MEILSLLFKEWSGKAPVKVTALTPSGSNRRYFRLEAGKLTAVGVEGTDGNENRAFICEARHFRSKGINVPEVLAVDSDGMHYLLEDLGDDCLFDLVRNGRESGQYSTEERSLLNRAISRLPEIQFEGGRDLDYGVCYPESEFNARMVDFDLNYFKYCFLKTSGLEFNEARLQDDFDKLRADLLSYSCNAFMYRDFQARNVMIKDGEPWFIDFQGGRRGPCIYDAASFIWQARSRFPSDVKEELAETYFKALKPYSDMGRDEFRSGLRVFVLFRMLQVLGAYGFRGRFERKPHFLQSIPAALDSLKELLYTPFAEYPYLNELLHSLADTKECRKTEHGRLEVTVWSFSYRKGFPEDRSGNGGGYVFDCRGMHNPGRYEQYKQSTGMDSDVISFLEEGGEVFGFLEHVYALADTHVERYIQRGFEHLQICFGCTGGQHRSVYCAEAAARHLHEKFGIRVRLIHREQGVEKTLG